MFRRIISLVILVIVSTMGLDLQASGKARRARKHTYALRSAGLPVGVGHYSPDVRAFARENKISLEQAAIMYDVTSSFIRELAESGRYAKKALSPQQRGALTRMMRYRKHGRAIKVVDRPMAEALGQFSAENIFAALQEAVNAGALKAKLDEIIAFAERITTGSRGKLAAAILETTAQLKTLRANLESLPNDAEIGILDDGGYCGGGDDLGGDDYVAPEISLKQRLMAFVRSNQRSGYKLLTVCTVFAGAAWFAPVYLPVALVGSAVGATVSATAHVVGSTVSGAPLTAGSVAESAIDGMVGGSISSVMPGGNFVNAGATGATISALRAVCEGKGAKEIGKDALVGGVASVAAYGATSWFFPQGAPVSVEEDRSRALMVVPQPQPLVVEPMAPLADHRPLMQGSGLPEFRFPAVEDRSRALVVVPQQVQQPVCLPMCAMDDAPVPLPTSMPGDAPKVGMWGSAKIFIEGALTGPDTGFWARAKERVEAHVTGPDAGFWSRAKETVRPHLPFGWQ